MAKYGCELNLRQPGNVFEVDRVYSVLNDVGLFSQIESML